MRKGSTGSGLNLVTQDETVTPGFGADERTKVTRTLLRRSKSRDIKFGWRLKWPSDRQIVTTPGR